MRLAAHGCLEGISSCSAHTLTSGTGNVKQADTSRLVIDVFTTNFSEVVLDPFMPRLCFLGLQFAQPFLVERAIDLISNPAGRNFYMNGGELFYCVHSEPA